MPLTSVMPYMAVPGNVRPAAPNNPANQAVRHTCSGREERLKLPIGVRCSMRGTGRPPATVSAMTAGSMTLVSRQSGSGQTWRRISRPGLFLLHPAAEPSPCLQAASAASHSRGGSRCPWPRLTSSGTHSTLAPSTSFSTARSMPSSQVWLPSRAPLRTRDLHRAQEGTNGRQLMPLCRL